VADIQRTLPQLLASAPEQEAAWRAGEFDPAPVRARIKEAERVFADFKIKLPPVTEALAELHREERLEGLELELYARLLEIQLEWLREAIGLPPITASTRPATRRSAPVPLIRAWLVLPTRTPYPDPWFLGEGDRLLTRLGEDSVALWSLEDGQQLATYAGRARVTSFAVSRDESLLATGSPLNVATVARLDGGGDTIVHPHEHTVTSVLFLPDGGTLLTGDVRGNLYISSTTAAVTRGSISPGLEGGVRLLMSPTGGDIVAWSQGHKLFILGADGTPRATLEDHEPVRVDAVSVADVVFSHDGSMIASAGSDKTVRVWNVKTGQLLHTLAGHAGPVLRLAFSRDDKLLASVSPDDSLRIWGATDGRLSSLIELPEGAGRAVAFSPDGAQVATGGSDGIVRLWDVATGQLAHQFLGASAGVTRVLFDPSGKALLAASEEGKLLVWKYPLPGS
jgi:WD40 repeat protein